MPEEKLEEKVEKEVAEKLEERPEADGPGRRNERAKKKATERNCERGNRRRQLKSSGRRARGIGRHKRHNRHNRHNRHKRRSRSRLPNDSSTARRGARRKIDEALKKKKKAASRKARPSEPNGSPIEARSPEIGFPVRTPETVGTFLEVGVRSRSRNARDEALRPQDEGRRRKACFSPTARPSSSLARCSPIRSRKTGSKTARAGLGGEPPRRATLPTGSESDVTKKRTGRTVDESNEARKSLSTRGLASRRAYALRENARPWGSIPRGRRTPSGTRRCGRPT